MALGRERLGYVVTSGHAGWSSRLPVVLAGPGGHKKRGGMPFPCMQEDASCRGLLVAPGWRQYLLEDHMGRCPISMETCPMHWDCVSGSKCPSAWGRLCLSLNAAYGDPGLGDSLIAGHILLSFYLRAIYH